jgi:acetylornithine deacetylase/succinyl-diaminopimelate desuccinylase-like protein
LFEIALGYVRLIVTCAENLQNKKSALGHPLTIVCSCSPIESCIAFVKAQAEDIGLEFHKLKLPPPGETVAWITWPGTDVSATSIMLNSHMDVVPADEVSTKYGTYICM